MLKRNNKYYFMWSEGSWGGSDYSVAYAIADSPFGPFERIGKILQQDESVGTGAGHHSVIQIPGKDEWFIIVTHWAIRFQIIERFVSTVCILTKMVLLNR